MSGPDDSKDDERRPHEPAHGLTEELLEAVEKVEHAVEDVVEHVPKPVRWTVGKIVALAGLTLAGLVVLTVVTAVLYVANRTEWAAQELTLVVNQLLATRSNVVLSIADIKGNPLTGVRVIHPRVRFRDGKGPTLLEAPAMSLRYSAWDLATGRRSRIVVDVERPLVRLERGADRRLRLPTWKSSGSVKKGTPRGLDIELHLRNAAVRLPDGDAAYDGVVLDAVAGTGNPTRVEVRELRWTRGPFGPLTRLRADVIAGDSVRVTVRDFLTPSLALRGHAEWRARSSERVVHVEVQRVKWAWLAQVFKNRTLDVPGEGSLIADARGGERWDGRFHARATWSDLPLAAQGSFSWAQNRLTLDPLVGQSDAGDLSGRVVWSKQGWEVGGVARDADPAHWGAIGLKGWPSGRLSGRFRYAVDTRGRPSANLWAELGSSEWSGWRADSGIVTVAFPAVGQDSFQVRALRRGGEIGLIGTVVEGGWRGSYEVARLPLDEWPDGRASGIHGVLVEARGGVESRPSGLWVTGSLSGAETDWLGMHAARWRLNEVQGVMVPTPDLSARAHLEDVTFLGIHFDSAGTPLALRGQSVALDSLVAQGGDSLVALRGAADWDKSGWRFSAARASLRSRELDWTADPPLLISGAPDAVHFDRLVAHDGEAHLTVAGQWAGPGGRYDWTARAGDLELSRLGLPDSLDLSGRASAVLRVWGVSGDPRWDLEAAASRPGARGHVADSLRIRLGGAPHRLDVREAALELDGGSLRVTGSVTEAAEAWPDTLTPDGIQAWLAHAGHWAGTMRAESFPLDRAGHLPATRSPMAGRLTANLDVGGRPDAPELSLTAEAKAPAWGDYRVDGASARARYAGDRLEVPELHMSRGGVTSSASGEMPIVLALGRKPELPDRPMSWRVDLPNGDLSLLPLFVPQIGFASGRFDLQATVAGTSRHPQIIGGVRVRDGKVRLAGREEFLDAVYADLTIQRSRLTLDTLSARQDNRRGEPGRLWGKGEVRLDGLAMRDYGFELRLRDFTAQEPFQYAALIDGDFTVAPGAKVRGQVLPHVEGQVEVRQAYVLFDFANQSEVQQIASTTQPLYWTYRLHLSATDNLSWRPPNADIEFSADLDLAQSPDSLVIYGDVRAIRGSYYFLSNRFTVQSAELTFDNVGGVNPQILAVAETEVPRASSGPLETSANSGRERITVTIRNRVREPQIEFASDSGWGEAEILRAITVGQFEDVRGGLALANPLDSYVTQAISRQLDAEMSRLFQGRVEQWEVRRESGGGVLVGASTQLGPIRVRYHQRIAGLDRAQSALGDAGVERDIEAEYRLNRFFVVTSEVTQRRTLTGGVTTVSGTPDFNVNLKARWEY